MEGLPDAHSLVPRAARRRPGRVYRPCANSNGTGAQCAGRAPGCGDDRRGATEISGGAHAHPPQPRDVEQPNFPAEIMRSNHTDSDWLQMARIAGRTATEITSVKVGWAYVLPTGLEFHQSEAIAPTGGGILRGWYDTGDLQVAPRADALDFLDRKSVVDVEVAD